MDYLPTALSALAIGCSVAALFVALRLAVQAGPAQLVRRFDAISEEFGELRKLVKDVSDDQVRLGKHVDGVLDEMEDVHERTEKKRKRSAAALSKAEARENGHDPYAEARMRARQAGYNV